MRACVGFAYAMFTGSNACVADEILSLCRLLWAVPHTGQL